MTVNRNISDETRRIRDHKNRDKRIETENRQKLAVARSAKEQIAVLDARLGENIGAVKERQRLHKKMGVE